MPLWGVILGAIGALAPVAWYLGPGIVMAVSRGCRMKRMVALVGAQTAVRLRPRVGVTVEADEGYFVSWEAGSARLDFRLRIEDTKDAPTDRLAYLTLVDNSRAPVEPGVDAELRGLLRDDAVVRHEGTSFVYESEETVAGLEGELVRGDAFLHVCCRYLGPYSADTVYTEQVYGFNINRDGLRAMPAPDTVYHRP